MMRKKNDNHNRKLLDEIKNLKITTSNRQSCSTNNLSTLSAIMVFAGGDKCVTQISPASYDKGSTKTFTPADIGICGERKYSSRLTNFELVMDQMDQGDDGWCFNSMEIEMKNGDLYGCNSPDPMKQIAMGEKVVCSAMTLLEKGTIHLDKIKSNFFLIRHIKEQ